MYEEDVVTFTSSLVGDVKLKQNTDNYECRQIATARVWMRNNGNQTAYLARWPATGNWFYLQIVCIIKLSTQHWYARARVIATFTPPSQLYYWLRLLLGVVIGQSTRLCNWNKVIWKIAVSVVHTVVIRNNRHESRAGFKCTCSHVVRCASEPQRWK